MRTLKISVGTFILLFIFAVIYCMTYGNIVLPGSIAVRNIVVSNKSIDIKAEFLDCDVWFKNYQVKFDNGVLYVSVKASSISFPNFRNNVDISVPNIFGTINEIYFEGNNISDNVLIWSKSEPWKENASIEANDAFMGNPKGPTNYLIQQGISNTQIASLDRDGTGEIPRIVNKTAARMQMNPQQTQNLVEIYLENLEEGNDGRTLYIGESRRILPNGTISPNGLPNNISEEPSGGPLILLLIIGAVLGVIGVMLRVTYLVCLRAGSDKRQDQRIE